MCAGACVRACTCVHMRVRVCARVGERRTIVNRDGCGVVKHVDVRVLAVCNHKHLSIQRPRLLGNLAAFHPSDLVVLRREQTHHSGWVVSANRRPQGTHTSKQEVQGRTPENIMSATLIGHIAPPCGRANLSATLRASCALRILWPHKGSTHLWIHLFARVPAVAPAGRQNEARGKVSIRAVCGRKMFIRRSVVKACKNEKYATRSMGKWARCDWTHPPPLAALVDDPCSPRCAAGACPGRGSLWFTWKVEEKGGGLSPHIAKLHFGTRLDASSYCLRSLAHSTRNDLNASLPCANYH